MVISNEYKYIFLEIPHTASTAISRELCAHYGGVRMLHKHATYHELIAFAGEQIIQDHVIIGGIRNPLDILVTSYFKLLTNHQGFFTEERFREQQGGHVSNLQLRRFEYVKQGESNFATFFNRFYKLPFDSYGSPRPKDFDFIIRFEQLQEDFARLLDFLGISAVRSLPTINKTAGRKEDYLSYYTPDIQSRAIWVFGPYMQRWGYDFPTDWEEGRLLWLSELQFHVLGVLRRRVTWQQDPLFHLLASLRLKLHI